MSNAPVSNWMVSPVQSIKPGARLEEAAKSMREYGVSALPVVGNDGRLAGVLSRTDLLRAGRVKVHEGRKRALALPDARVEEFMNSTVEVVGTDATMGDCAQRMCKHLIHRVYVVSNGHLEGVVGTKEMMAAVIELRVKIPIREMISGSLIVVKTSDPLRLAIDRMQAAHRSGLVVVDGQWPVGIFSQAEALAAREAPPDDEIEGWMNSSLLCLPTDIPVWRAAQQAHDTGVRRVLGLDGRDVKGILSGLDFAAIVKA